MKVEHSHRTLSTDTPQTRSLLSPPCAYSRASRPAAGAATVVCHENVSLLCHVKCQSYVPRLSWFYVLLMTRRIGRGGRKGQTHTATPKLRSYSVPPASEVTVIRGDGTTEIFLRGSRRPRRSSGPSAVR